MDEKRSSKARTGGEVRWTRNGAQRRVRVVKSDNNNNITKRNKAYLSPATRSIIDIFLVVTLDTIQLSIGIYIEVIKYHSPWFSAIVILDPRRNQLQLI
jgi:hypothetical protein